MHTENFLSMALVYLAAAVLAVPLARRTGLGSVLGYLIAGAAVGPHGLDLLGGADASAQVMHFAEFGVVMMLFLIGLELQPRLLWRMRGPIAGLGGVQVLLTAAVLTGLGVASGHWLDTGIDLRSATAIGLILALSSTAIVLQSLAEKGISDAPVGRSAFAVLLLQDIAVIPMLALLPLLASDMPVAPAVSGHLGDTEPHDDKASGLLILGAVAGVVIGGRFLARPAFRYIAAARLPEVFTAAALLLVVGISLAMTAVGLSAALGTFLAGVVLADNEYRHELEADIEPFKGLLLGLFFISVGAQLDFGLVGDRPATILGLVALLVSVKFGVLLLLGRLSSMAPAQRTLFGLALAQGGEFAFVLFEFARQQNVLGVAEVEALIAVVALSMALTPLLLLAEEHLLRPRRRPAATEDDTGPAPIDEGAPVLIAGSGRFGLVIARLLRAHGCGATVLDIDPAQIRMLERFGFRTWYGDASRADLLAAAGAARAKLLVIAVDSEAASLAIVATAQREFPHLRILARARGRPHAYRLMRHGVHDVQRETQGSAVALGAATLRALGMGAHEAHRAAALFDRHDERNVREMAAHFGDEQTYVSVARERILALEQLLSAERESFGVASDDAWDPPEARPDQPGKPGKPTQPPA